VSSTADREPEFVREALDEEQVSPEVLEALHALPALLRELPSPLGRERLLRATAEPVRRYAPFFDRLSELWDLPESELERLFERAAQRSAWRKPGLPGVSLIDVSGGPRRRGADLRLARFAPGMRFPAHRHLGLEMVLVLEGSFRDGSGNVVRAGDLQTMAPGSEHSFRADSREPCIAASVQFGIEFTGVALRWITRLLGRG
jgi:quercetin dioxygenase-like cupin family protein